MAGVTWFDAKGTVVNYFNWAKGQPDGLKKSEKCLEMWTTGACIQSTRENDLYNSNLDAHTVRTTADDAVIGCQPYPHHMRC
eukprot:7307748-Prymnesium_polylepis.1